MSAKKIIEIKVGPCPNPNHKSNKSHHCLVNGNIYLHNDCNENNAERVLLHESIHSILYHFLDEEKLNDYTKEEELISSQYDNPSKLVFPQSKYWFSSLLENWYFQEWIFTVDYLMKIKWKK
jgi:hypothetical protein